MSSSLAPALLGGAVGVALTTINGHVTGWVSRRHERRQRLEDRRQDAYVAFGAAVNVVQTAYRRRIQESQLDSLNAAIEELATRRYQLLLVAPTDTGAAADEVMRAARNTLAALVLPQSGVDPEAKMAEMMEHSRTLLKLQQRDVTG